jgi:hypothetical protein
MNQTTITYKGDIPDELLLTIEGLRDLALSRWPGEDVTIAQVPLFFQGQQSGFCWCRITNTHKGVYDHITADYDRPVADVETLSGQPVFPFASANGAGVVSTKTVPTKSLGHVVQILASGTIAYKGKGAELMPAWCEDEGSTEYILRQQEFVNEQRGYCACGGDPMENDRFCLGCI